ncbi:MAG: inositol monophosphatase family protein, partial [Asticcacaulis sp.]
MDFNPIMLAAGAEILRIYATDFTVASKGDASPVTEADGRAERIILDGLARIAPDIPVVAEEEAAAGRLPDTGRRF